MDYILYFFKFIYRIRWWVILGTTIITVAVLYATRNMPKTYTVEATRVGRQTNLDKLVLKIWTNGTINPRAALDEASRLLANSFSLIYQPSSSAAVEADVTDAKSTVSPEALKLTIDELDLPTRIYNSLRNGGIETVEELLNTPRKELISMRNMGGKSLAVIEDKLRTKGISLSA